MAIGRKEPYTRRGISRVKCAVHNCKKSAAHQWNCCALENRWLPICQKHDVELNRLACELLLGEKAKPIIAIYQLRSAVS